MKNFIFKSTDADLQKMFRILDTILADVLYVTHRMDYLVKEFKKSSHDKDLQATVDKYFEETSPQTDSDEQQLVIKTVVKPRGPTLPSKRPGQLIYETIKYGLKTMGWYDEYDLQRFDPGYYVEKYTYKPQKRVSGYLGKAIHSQNANANSKFRKAYSRHGASSGYYYKDSDNRQSCNSTQQYCGY